LQEKGEWKLDQRCGYYWHAKSATHFDPKGGMYFANNAWSKRGPPDAPPAPGTAEAAAAEYAATAAAAAALPAGAYTRPLFSLT